MGKQFKILEAIKQAVAAIVILYFSHASNAIANSDSDCFVLGFSGNLAVKSDSITNAFMLFRSVDNNPQYSNPDNVDVFKSKSDLTGATGFVGWKFFPDLVVGIETGYKTLDFKTKALTDFEQHISTDIIHAALMVDKYFIYESGFDIIFGLYVGAAKMMLYGDIETYMSSDLDKLVRFDDDFNSLTMGLRLAGAYNINNDLSLSLGYLFTKLPQINKEELEYMRGAFTLTDLRYSTHSIELGLRVFL